MVAITTRQTVGTFPSVLPDRRDDRVADCAALEMLCPGNRTGGSNPPLSVLLTIQRGPSSDADEGPLFVLHENHQIFGHWTAGSRRGNPDSVCLSYGVT